MFDAFGTQLENEKSSTTNLKDALSFLSSLEFVNKDKNKWDVKYKIRKKVFKLDLLKTLRRIQLDNKNKKNILDPYFMGILDILFVKEDIVFRNDLHKSANQIDIPEPLSKEKINAWKRVMEYLGIGFRGYSGFLFNYHPYLLLNIIQQWRENSGPLQIFLESHLNKYLPWENLNGDITISLRNSLLYLEKENEIKLSFKQDLPNKRYFKDKNLNWIERR